MSEVTKKGAFKNSLNDFDNNSLPSTRIKLFKKIFLSRIGKLILVNLLAFMFFIPLILWDLFALSYKSNIDDISSMTNFVLTVESPVKIITYLIAFLGLAGIIYYVRKLSWGEPVKLFKTFFIGIKQSYKQFLIFGFLFSILICLFELAFNVMKFVDYGKLYSILFTALLFVGLILLLCVNSYCLTMSSLYYLSGFSIVKNAFLLTIKNIFLNVLIVLITYGLLLMFLLVGNVYLYFIGVFIVGFIGLSYCCLVWIIFANKSYDVYINLNQYPEYFRKGLRKSKKEGIDNA